LPSLPTGTVTFLFTDIEGSTRLLQHLGDRYAEVLATHHRLLRNAIHEAHGQVVDTQGDAVFAAFPRARDALLAAIAAQRALQAHPWPDGIILRVRMGLHTGEPGTGETGYVGMDVHRAARIAAAGHGGQILLSDTTHALVAKDPPQGIELRDLGEHRLKDLAQPHRLFQIVTADLPGDFPSLRSLDAHPHNLPTQLTSFIGREREKDEVKRLLSASRFVTVTGSGGAGKTRLALQVAAEGLEEFSDGVWLVELAALSDPNLVPKAVASALGAPEQPGRALTETLADALRHKSALIILDNCEHLVPPCAQLADSLLRACPKLRILATSREALGVAGETTWLVPSMSVPNPQRLPSLDGFTEYEAIRLFIDRAVASAPQFAVTSSNAPAVAQVCSRLDGIPLAIELAAARVKVLSAEQIASRLDERFRLLTGGSRTALPRQQTLRAAMDWSFDLLSQKERALLRQLSVFAGGWTLDAAEAICSGGGIEAADILDLLTQLVDKSLVVVDTEDGEVRYRLLETVREYGRTRLREVEEPRDVQRRHRDWYLAFAERAEPELRGPNQLTWLRRLEDDHDNLRAALEWSRTETPGNAAGLRLAVALYRFWEIRGHFAEARAWLDLTLSLNRDAVPRLRARALNWAGHLAHRQGDPERVSTLCGEAFALAQAVGDEHESAQALHYLAHAAEIGGDHCRAAELLESSVALHRAAGNTPGLGAALQCLGNAARHSEDYPKAAALYDEAVEVFQALGDALGKARTLHSLGYVRLRQGDRQGSQSLFRESLTLAKELGDRRVINCLAGLAATSAESNPQWAVKLYSAAAALMSAANIRLEPVTRRDVDHYMAVAKERLGDAGFSAAWAEGRAMTLEQAVEYALKKEPRDQ
jgi:predicted ATPase/class 3 adenylate cyclase